MHELSMEKRIEYPLRDALRAQNIRQDELVSRYVQEAIDKANK